MLASERAQVRLPVGAYFFSFFFSFFIAFSWRVLNVSAVFSKTICGRNVVVSGAEAVSRMAYFA